MLTPPVRGFVCSAVDLQVREVVADAGITNTSGQIVAANVEVQLSCAALQDQEGDRVRTRLARATSCKGLKKNKCKREAAKSGSCEWDNKKSKCKTVEASDGDLNGECAKPAVTFVQDALVGDVYKASANIGQQPRAVSRFCENAAVGVEPQLVVESVTHELVDHGKAQ